MEYPWKYYEKSVGIWTIESGRGVHSFPLDTKSLDMEGVAREYFHYFDGVVRALEGLFRITSVEYREMVMAGTAPLDLFMAKQALLEAWKKDLPPAWMPVAVFRGLAEVAVWVEDKAVLASLPDAIALMLGGRTGSDRYELILATGCDIWLSRTISGADNPVGEANARRLEDALRKLEDALDGKVARFATEYDGVAVNEHGFG